MMRQTLIDHIDEIKSAFKNAILYASICILGWCIFLCLFAIDAISVHWVATGYINTDMFFRSTATLIVAIPIAIVFYVTIKD